MPNALLFAKSLFALHEAGVLRDPGCKGAVKTFIRQVSEDPHWHVSAHYRSRKAAEKIASANIRSKAQYQAFCRKKENELCHEHMVPGAVVYELITTHKTPSVEAFYVILRRTSFRATITKGEDRRLLRDSVPDLGDFRDPASSNYLNHMVRYVHAGIATELEPCPLMGWFAAAA